jgi:hypothetical protein
VAILGELLPFVAILATNENADFQYGHQVVSKSPITLGKIRKPSETSQNNCVSIYLLCSSMQALMDSCNFIG